MLTPHDHRLALSRVASAAVSIAQGNLADLLDASPTIARRELLDAVPQLISRHALGSAVLAADYYEDARAAVGAPGRFRADTYISDRDERIRRGIKWATEPLFDESLESDPAARLAEIVQYEVARPNRDTITENVRRDPSAAGWKRITRSNGCRFCRMLAEKGAIYKRETARFAAHPNCNCVAQPWFEGQPIGEEASVLQYVASGRRRSEREKERLRDYLKAMPDAPEPPKRRFGNVLRDDNEMDLLRGPISDTDWEDSWGFHRSNSDFRYLPEGDDRAQGLLMYNTSVGENVKDAAANLEAGRPLFDGIDLDENVRLRNMPLWQTFETDGYGRLDYEADIRGAAEWLTSKPAEKLGESAWRGINFPVETSWDDVLSSIDLDGWKWSSASTKQATALRYAGRPDRSKSVLFKIDDAEAVRLPGVGNHSNNEEVLISGRIEITSTRFIPDDEGYGERLLVEAKWVR